jgi:hypothetical protein
VALAQRREQRKEMLMQMASMPRMQQGMPQGQAFMRAGGPMPGQMYGAMPMMYPGPNMGARGGAPFPMMGMPQGGRGGMPQGGRGGMPQGFMGVPRNGGYPPQMGMQGYPMQQPMGGGPMQGQQQPRQPRKAQGQQQQQRPGAPAAGRGAPQGGARQQQPGQVSGSNVEVVGD